MRMGLKEKTKSRHRALVKVILFIVRVQKSQKKKQSLSEQENDIKSEFATTLTIPVLSPSSSSVGAVTPNSTSTNDKYVYASSSIRRSTSNRSSRDWLSKNHRHQSFLSIWDDIEDGFDYLSVRSAGTLYSRSRASSSVSRCSFNSRSSGGGESLTSVSIEESAVDGDEEKVTRFVDFTSMNKPYTLNGFGELATVGGITLSNAKSNSKNVNVTCNSVMGDPRKLSKKLIRRGSMAETRDDRFSVRPSTSGSNGNTTDGNQSQKKDAGFMGKVLVRQQTTDCTQLRPLLHRCTSDENVAGVGVNLLSGADVSHRTGSKFVKRKSSADLLLMTNDTGGGFSSATLDRMSTSTTGRTAAISTSQLSKMDKKKLDKMKEDVKQLQELFTAVEQDDIGKVRSILHRGDIEMNGTNSDGLTLLDEATMLNHTEVALLLLKSGAQENQKLGNVAQRSKHLQLIIDCAQAKLSDLNVTLSKQSSSATGSSTTLVKNLEKQISSWESKLHTLKKMRNNLETSAFPSPPKNITLNVSSCTSLIVSFEPPDQQIGIAVTKYKVEWSQYEDFHELTGNLCVYDLRRLEITITNLITGQIYFVRVSAGTYKGFGEPAMSLPPYAVPSSWRDVDQTLNRSAGRLEAITDLFHELRKLKKTDLWERIAYTGDAALKKKKTSGGALKNLFSSNAKFQKNLKRGVYLASILYKDDKVLCTVDDCLPVVEVDDTVPTTLGPDFQWFMKLSCAWEDMRSLHFDLDMTNQSPSLIFRLKLLQAAASMQAALGTQDLGRLHSVPIIDNKGVTVLVTVQFVHESKLVQGLTVKWHHMNKLLKKQTTTEKDQSTMDVLIGNLVNFLNFYESTYIPLDRGLYLGYVKLHTSINQISIVVPENLPSVLPFVFIRDNPHVSREEWDWLRVMDTDLGKDFRPNPAQLAFHRSLASAARVLLNDLNLGDDELNSHRIYRLEVVEIHSDVSFILLVPSHDDVCLPPGQSRMVTDEKKACVTLAVPMFEVAHLCTYQPDFIALYCRLSVFLEFYWIVLQQLHRQTLNEDEAKTYRQLLDILNGHQQRLEDVWKSTRWITSVVTAARDRQLRSSLPLSVLFAYDSDPTSFMDSHRRTSACGADTMLASGSGSLSRIKRNDSNGDKQYRQNSNAIYENGLDPEPGPSTGRGSRTRRASGGEQSLSEDQAEENSDVGYHSDQSLEKLAAGTAATANTGNDENISNNSRLHAASNPTYDFPENFLQNHTSYVNVDELKSNEDNNEPISGTVGVDYLVNRLHVVQRVVPESTSKLVEAKYGKYEPSSTCDLALSKNDEGSKKQFGQSRKSLPTIPNYRTEIMVDESSDQLSSGTVFDVQFKVSTTDTPAVNAGQRAIHDYVNVTPLISEPKITVALSPTCTSGNVQVGVIAPTTSDSEASCSSTSTSSSLKRQYPRCQTTWISSDEKNRVIEEDLSVIDKLYAEAASRFPSSSSSTSVTPTPTVIVTQKSASRPSSSASSTRSAASISSDRSSSTARVQSPQAGVLRVYAAYPCGLAKGTSVKLHVSPKTTAKEVVTLVIRQLNKAVEMKGLKGPVYAEEEMSDFVLVVVIGARERCLRDDFPPLDLQNPWCKGKLFIRRKNDILAALEFGNEAKV